MHNDNFRFLLAAFAFSSFLGLAGCSGGGGSDSDGLITYDGDTSGTVAKGIVINGQVTAEELDTSGNVIRQVGSTTTDASGDYSLSIESAYAGGVILLTLSSDGSSTQMMCDVRPDCGGVLFGSAMDLPASFSMTALLPEVQDGASVSAQITPLTHMAASRVAAGGSYTANAVKLATSEISQMVGTDILYTSPLDITDGDAVETSSDYELAYAAFTAGLGALMFEATDLTAGLEALASAFADGDFDGEDLISIASIIESVTEQATESGIDTQVLDQVLATIEADLVDLDGDGEVDDYDPEPSDAVLLSDLEQAKALVSEIRTLVSSIEELESPATLLRTELELSKTVLNQNTQALSDMLTLVLTQVFDDLAAKIAEGTALGYLQGGTSYDLTILDYSLNVIGTVSVSLTENNGLELSVAGTGLSRVNLNLVVNSNLPAIEVLTIVDFDVSQAAFRLDGSLEIVDITNTVETSIDLDTMDMTYTLSADASLVADPDYPLNFTFDSDLIDGISLSGGILITDLETSSSFTGDAIIELVKLTDNADDPDNPNPVSVSKIALDGLFEDISNNSFEADLSLSINNAATIDTIAYLDYETSLQVYGTEPGDVLGFSTHEYAAGGTLYVAGYLSLYDMTCFYIDFYENCYPGDLLNASTYFAGLYPDAIFIGDFTVWYDVVGAIEPILDYTGYDGYVEFADFETADSYLQATLTATLDLVLDGYPDTKVVVTVDRTDLDGGDAIVTLSHDSNSITIKATLTDVDTVGVGTVLVTNPDGVALTMSVDTLSGSITSDIYGEVTVDGVSQATIEETDLGVVLVRYIDGTFESLY